MLVSIFLQRLLILTSITWHVKSVELFLQWFSIYKHYLFGGFEQYLSVNSISKHVKLSGLIQRLA
jgi:hypothetical protein